MSIEEAIKMSKHQNANDNKNKKTKCHQIYQNTQNQTIQEGSGFLIFIF